MIHDEIVTYEVAKLAKEKGFNEYVEAFYAEGCDTAHSQGPEKWNEYKGRYAAPTQSLLQRWLREEKGLIIAISVDIDHDLHRLCYQYGICYYFDGRTMEYHNCYDAFGRYELALEDALKYALENLV